MAFLEEGGGVRESQRKSKRERERERAKASRHCWHLWLTLLRPIRHAGLNSLWAQLSDFSHVLPALLLLQSFRLSLFLCPAVFSRRCTNENARNPEDKKKRKKRIMSEAYAVSLCVCVFCIVKERRSIGGEHEEGSSLRFGLDPVRPTVKPPSQPESKKNDSRSLYTLVATPLCSLSLSLSLSSLFLVASFTNPDHHQHPSPFIFFFCFFFSHCLSLWGSPSFASFLLCVSSSYSSSSSSASSFTATEVRDTLISRVLQLSLSLSFYLVFFFSFLFI